MLALIDGDIVCYRVAWTTENDNEGIARARCDEMLDGILIDTRATGFTVFLSDSAENNFRYKIYPEYKANRASLPKPKFLDVLKEHVIKAWAARIAFGQEADDALGIEQIRHWNWDGEEGNDSVICSIDKDLQQIPGNHYNFVKKEFNSVTPEQGLKTFYKQILIGDVADNIRGCPGIGPVKAGKLIDGVRADGEVLERIILDTYIKKGGFTEEEARKHIEQVGQVLKIRQEEEEPLWHFLLPSQTVGSPASSIQPTQEAITQSTVPTTAEKVSGT